MVISRANSMGINLMEGTKNPFQVSNISKLQDFYGLSYIDLFDETEMKKKGVKKEDLEYIKENREVEFAKKPTEGFELRDVQGKEKYKKLQQFYGFSLKDTQDTDKLLKLGMNNEDILYITGKDLDEKKTSKSKEVFKKIVKEAQDEVIAEMKKDLGGVSPIALGSKGTPEIEDAKEAEIGGIELLDEISELREQYKKEHGKYPSSQMKLETLKKKLGVKN